MVDTSDCLPQVNAFIETSLLVFLVVTAFTLRHQVKKEDIPPIRESNALYDHLQPKFRCEMAGIALGLEVWGVAGFFLSGKPGCPASHWLVVLCLSLSGGCMLIGTWMGVREALLTVDYDMLTILRCSCCSRLTKRALLLPPLALLVTLNIASWLESRCLIACNASTLFPPTTFFAGTAFVFLAMFVATMLAVCYPLSRKCRKTSLRPNKMVVALGLAAVALASIGWSTVGFMGLLKRSDRAALDVISCWDDPIVVHAAQWSIIQLLLVGSMLLLTTLCCRLENFFLAANVPEIDLAQLSPRLAAMKAYTHTNTSTCHKPSLVIL